MNETIIISGGNINLEFLKEILLNKKFNNIIAVDKGLESLDKLSVNPNYIIGDFDSINKLVLEKYKNNSFIEITYLTPEKDYTDTHVALKKAIELKSTSITIIGAIGTRIDHVIANIHILKEALEKNIECKIVNENNIIRLINKKTVLKLNSNYKYISLIPFTNSVTGITLEGFKYTLNNGCLTLGKSIGISNEQIKDNATIDLKEGILILIQAKD